jgi:hypothetical protein
MLTNFEKINQPRADGFPKVKEIKAEKEPSLVDFDYMDKPLKEISYEKC